MFRRRLLWRITIILSLCLFSRIWICVFTRSFPLVCISNFARRGGTPWNYLWTIDIMCFVKYAVQTHVSRYFVEIQWKILFSILVRALVFPKTVFCNGGRDIHDIIAKYCLNSDVWYYMLRRSSNPTHIFRVGPSCEMFLLPISQHSLWSYNPKCYGWNDTRKLRYCPEQGFGRRDAVVWLQAWSLCSKICLSLSFKLFGISD